LLAFIITPLIPEEVRQVSPILTDDDYLSVDVTLPAGPRTEVWGVEYSATDLGRIQQQIGEAMRFSVGNEFGVSGPAVHWVSMGWATNVPRSKVRSIY
jgi:hypothetical protein